MRAQKTDPGRLRLWLVVLLATVLAAPGFSQSSPRYTAQAVGVGFPIALNESGQLIGWRSEADSQRAWISTDGGAVQLLPLPAGRTSSYANDINDSGVVVGKACDGSPCEIGSPVVWTPSLDGYRVELIGTFLGESYGELTGVNNRGDLIGVAGSSFVTPFVITPEAGVQDLGLLGFFAEPAAINDARQIVGGTVNQRLNLESGVVDDLGVPVAAGRTYLWTVPFDINASGQVTGYAQLETGGSDDQVVVRYTDGLGWEVLGVPGAFDTGYGINDAGSVRAEMYRCGDIQPTVRFEGVGTSCLGDLMVEEGWFFLSSFGGDVNNSGQMIAWGGNADTGEGGAILLTPVGVAGLGVASSQAASIP